MKRFDVMGADRRCRILPSIADVRCNRGNVRVVTWPVERSPAFSPNCGPSKSMPRKAVSKIRENDLGDFVFHVPRKIRQIGGRKIIQPPNGTAGPDARHIDNAMVKAIVRAFRWREKLESGECATIREIAAAEKINESYIGRILRLTLLAPNIIEEILGMRQTAILKLRELRWQFSAIGPNNEILSMSKNDPN
jgi:hypothetical protein